MFISEMKKIRATATIIFQLCIFRSSSYLHNSWNVAQCNRNYFLKRKLSFSSKSIPSRIILRAEGKKYGRQSLKSNEFENKEDENSIKKERTYEVDTQFWSPAEQEGAQNRSKGPAAEFKRSTGRGRSQFGSSQQDWRRGGRGAEYRGNRLDNDRGRSGRGGEYRGNRLDNDWGRGGRGGEYRGNQLDNDWGRGGQGGEYRGNQLDNDRGRGGRGGEYRGDRLENKARSMREQPRSRGDNFNYRRYQDSEDSSETSVIKAEEGSDYLYGINPILNALTSKKRELQQLFVQEGMDSANKKDVAAADEILRLAEELRVERINIDKHNLNLLCDNRPHQGFVLRAKPLEFTTIHVLEPTSEKKVWMALDEVWDPQNFGALLRSAHFFGIDGVVTCSKNSAKLTAAVSKASAGACEAMEVHSANNMMRFLSQSKENGWRVVGLSLTQDSIPLEQLMFDRPTILVLGNEGHGLRTNVLRQCEVLCRIGGSPETSVDSLNVSVTGGILLHFFSKQ